MTRIAPVKSSRTLIASALVKLAKSVLADNEVKCAYVDLGFPASDTKAFTILNNVFGQLSDGLWENSRRMEGYWRFANVVKEKGRISLEIEARQKENTHMPDRRGNDIWESNKWYDTNHLGKYWLKSADEICDKMANFLKRIVKEEEADFHELKWDRRNTATVKYLSDDNCVVTVADAYRCYDTLKRRSTKIYG